MMGGPELGTWAKKLASRHRAAELPLQMTVIRRALADTGLFLRNRAASGGVGSGGGVS
jgi:hypothetical protein